MDERLEKLGDMAIEVAGVMKDGAPQLWELYVRQQVLSGWFTLAGSLSALVFSVYVMWAIKGNWGQIVKADNEPPFALLWAFALMGAVAGAIGLGASALHVLNPEYYAAQELLSLVK